MAGCSKLFVSVAAMILHLESGACVSGMNREQLNDLLLPFGESTYRCPDMGCGKEFGMLSGMMQHMESEVCEAYRFYELPNGMNSD